MRELVETAERVLVDLIYGSNRSLEPWCVAAVEQDDDLGPVASPPLPRYKDSDFV